MNKPYEVNFEVAGPAAMFTRPDTGSTPISYPVPTYSAAKAMFEATARIKSAFIRPTQVEICEPVRYERYVTNYGGPLRKPNTKNYQLTATILVDVCYRIYGVVEATGTWNGPNNHLHTLKAIFERRLAKGQSFYTPCLGWKEFVPSYFGPLRDDTRPREDINVIIPSLLHSMWDQPTSGKLRPTFRQNVKVKAGIMPYGQGKSADAE